MRKYKNRLPLVIHTENGSYKQGETFEKDFTAEDELENVNSGLLEIMPQRYKVIGESRVFDHAPGEEFDAALLLGNEQALIEGGNIKLVKPKEEVEEPKKAAPRKRKAKKEEVKG